MPTTLPAQDEVFYSSAVTEHIVPKDKQLDFRHWYQTLTHTMEQAEGYVRVDLHSPLACENDVIKWYSIIHFDSQTHLDNWLNSSDREELMKAGQEYFETYRFKSFTTGAEGWFSHETGEEVTNLGPSAWKEALIVVLGLYPVVILQSKLFEHFGIMQSWSYANSMLVNLCITTIILTWFVMPRITQPLEFWLRPAYAFSETKKELMGVALIAVVMIAMVLLFNHPTITA